MGDPRTSWALRPGPYLLQAPWLARAQADVVLGDVQLRQQCWSYLQGRCTGLLPHWLGYERPPRRCDIGQKAGGDDLANGDAPGAGEAAKRRPG